MSKFVYLLLIIFVSCSTVKKGNVRMPKFPRVEKTTNRDIEKYGEEFAKKDWTKLNQKDTVNVVKYDSLIFGN
jgi:hypothetical protein